MPQALTRLAVLDTSVVIKWFHHRAEEATEAALALRGAYLNGLVEVAVPDLSIYEFANALKSKAGLTAADTAQMVVSLWALGFSVVPVMPDRSTAAVELAYRHDLTIYDATFLALAQELSASFITADRALYEKVADLDGVVLLSSLA